LGLPSLHAERSAVLDAEAAHRDVQPAVLLASPEAQALVLEHPSPSGDPQAIAGSDAWDDVHREAILDAIREVH
jgi:hypothetical protein